MVSATDGTVVGVVDPSATVGDALAATRERVTVIEGTVSAVLEADPSFVVTTDRSAIGLLVRSDHELPVLPVACGPDVRSIQASDLESAVAAVLDGRAERTHLETLAVEVPTVDPSEGSGTTPEGDATVSTADYTHRAAFSVALFPDEPARISEYAIRWRDELLARVRADGVVVATPAGTRGYAGAAGGAVCSVELGALVVVPVSPFTTTRRQWILPAEEVSISVERDECPISLQADDEVVGRVDTGVDVSVTTGAELEILLVDGSEREFST